MDEQRPPPEVKGSVSPLNVDVVAHPFAKLRPSLATSEFPGKHKFSTADKLSPVFEDVAVTREFWNIVEAPETRRVGNVEASCRSEGGEFVVDSDSQGLVLISPDNLKDKNKLIKLFLMEGFTS